MQEVEVTFGRAAQVWWAFIWRASLFSLLFAVVIGFVVGLTGNVLGFNSQQMLPFSMFLGATLGIVISIWVQSKILKKKFSSFRIALIQD